MIGLINWVECVIKRPVCVWATRAINDTVCPVWSIDLSTSGQVGNQYNHAWVHNTTTSHLQGLAGWLAPLLGAPSLQAGLPAGSTSRGSAPLLGCCLPQGWPDPLSLSSPAGKRAAITLCLQLTQITCKHTLKEKQCSNRPLWIFHSPMELKFSTTFEIMAPGLEPWAPIHYIVNDLEYC